MKQRKEVTSYKYGNDAKAYDKHRKLNLEREAKFRYPFGLFNLLPKIGKEK